MFADTSYPLRTGTNTFSGNNTFSNNLTLSNGLTLNSGVCFFNPKTTFPVSTAGSQTAGLQVYYNQNSLGDIAFVDGSGGSAGAFYFYTHGFYTPRTLLFSATTTQLNCTSLNIATSGSVGCGSFSCTGTVSFTGTAGVSFSGQLTSAGIDATSGICRFLPNTTIPSSAAGGQQLGLQVYFNANSVGDYSIVAGCGSALGAFYFYSHGYYNPRQLLFSATTTAFNIQGLNFSTTGNINGISPTTLAFLDATSSIQTQLNSKAPIASPTFTRTPSAPTATPGTNTTQIASTAFVAAIIAALTKTSVGLGLVDNTSDLTKLANTVAASNVWTGTNSYNTSLPTSTLTPSSGSQLITKTYADSTYTTRASIVGSNNVWTGSNAYNTSVICTLSILIYII